MSILFSKTALIVFGLFCFVGLSIVKPVIAGTTTDSLVGYWKLDEITSGGSDSVIDSSGGGYNGTPSGAGGANNKPQPSTLVPTTSFPDPRSLSFDGTDDAVTINSALDASVYGTNARTISFWFQANAFDTATGDTMFALASGASSGTHLGVAAEDNGVSVAFNGHRIIFAKNQLNTGVWLDNFLQLNKISFNSQNFNLYSWHNSNNH
jgi:hypothetical protein